MFKRVLASCAMVIAVAGLAACGHKPLKWDMDYVGAQMSPFEFSAMESSGGHTVSADHYLGKVLMVYFGYTHCPDVCPLTMSHMARAVQLLGPEAKDVHILFVTVDPKRDTPQVLKAYTAAFSPQASGLTGTPQQIKALATRYHVAYSYGKPDQYGNYTVTHSAAIYVFNQKEQGVLIGTEVTPPAKIAHDLKQIIGQQA